MPETASRIRLRDLSEWGYRVLTAAQAQMEADALSDGSARWVAVPYTTTRAIMDQRAGVGVLLSIEVTSDVAAADLSWMAAKAYSYALYTGCIDLLKRRASWVGHSRALGVGSSESTVAEIGPVRMCVRVRVIESLNDPVPWKGQS